jgi:hypothetical protein
MRSSQYEIVEGETVAGVILGWNFGDGHLHDEQLLARSGAVPLRRGRSARHPAGIAAHPPAMAGVPDRRRGPAAPVEKGRINVVDMVRRQPWLDGDPSIAVTVTHPSAAALPTLETT